MLRFTIFILLFTSVHLFGIALASAASDSLKFEQHFSEAERLNKEQKFRQSIIHLKQAGKYAISLAQEANINLKIAWNYIDLNLIDSARFYINENLNINPSEYNTYDLRILLSSSYRLMKVIHIKEGNYQNAIDVLLKSVDILKKDNVELDLSESYLDIGVNYWRLGDYESSILWTRKALILSEKIASRKMLIRSYIMLGLVYWKFGDLEKAIDHYKFVFTIIGDNIEENARDYLITCSNIAIIYKHIERYDEALAYYAEAQEYLEVVKEDDTNRFLVPYYQSSIFNNIGSVHVAKENYKLALEYYKKCLEVRTDYFGLQHPQVASIYANMANVLIVINDYDGALRALKKAFFINKQNFGESHEAISSTYNLFGKYYYAIGDTEESQRYYDSALMSNPHTELKEGIIFSSTSDAQRSLAGKVRGLSANEEDKLEATYNMFKFQMEFVYSKTNQDILEREILETIEQLYIKYTDLYRKDGNIKWVERLWNLSEYNKGRKLMARVRHKAAALKTLPQEYIERERNIRDSISTAMNNASDNKRYYDSLLFELNERYDNLIAELESEYPEYVELRSSLSDTGSKLMTSRIEDGDLILNFLQGKDKLYIILVKTDTVILRETAKSVLRESINVCDQNLKLTKAQLIPNFAVLKKLILGKETLNGVKNLEVIPDGIAWRINFSLFPVDDNTIFFGEQANILYQYSTRYLAVLQKKESPETNDKVLAFSFSEEESFLNSPVAFRDVSDELPGASLEVKQISELWDGHYYYASNASETTFKEKCSGYKILHMALHGTADDISPQLSRLYFAKEDSLNDGILHAYEIYNLNINSDLAVLSACKSGFGKVTTGEGVVSLGHAFAYAGVNSLLLSKWEVSDVTSPFIMRYFYEGLKSGLRKSEALKYAKLEFLKHDADNITSSPYYWDSFYIMGDDSPVVKDFIISPEIKAYFVITMAALLVLLIYYRYRQVPRDF